VVLHHQVRYTLAAMVAQVAVRKVVTELMLAVQQHQVRVLTAAVALHHWQDQAAVLAQ
jgi:hypothetical protein